MSELSPLCAAKRTSADRSGLRFTSKVPDGQITSDFQKSCQAPFAKIFLFSFEANQFTDSYCPVPIEGRCATSSTWSGMRWTRTARETSADCLRTVKSCGSDAPILGVKPVRRSAGDGVKQRGHRGEREVSRKTIARGMPGRSGVTVVTTLVRFLFCVRGCGCIERPAFPAPSVF
jgi:hypothetical protein